MLADLPLLLTSSGLWAPLGLLGTDGAAANELPAHELAYILILFLVFGVQWLMRTNDGNMAPQHHSTTSARLGLDGSAGLVASLASQVLDLPTGQRNTMPAQGQTAAGLFGTSPPRQAPRDRPEQAGAVDAVSRWCPEFSAPLFLDFVVTLYGALLRRRGDDDFGPLEPLLRPGARQELSNLAGVSAVGPVSVGPARLVSHTADESWIVLDVEAWALVEETWQGEVRTRLRRDRLRMQLVTGSPAVPPGSDRARIETATADDLVLPPEVGGWVLAQLVASDALPVTPKSIHDIDGPHCSEIGRPRRVPSHDLDTHLRGLDGRHPDQGMHWLLDRAEALAPASLLARQVDGEDDDIAAGMTGIALHLHDFWRAVARTAPPADPDQGREAFVPARCTVEATRMVDVRLDPWCELVSIGVTLSAPELVGQPGHRHEELWLFGRRVGDDDSWKVMDIKWAPVPTRPPLDR